MFVVFVNKMRVHEADNALDAATWLFNQMTSATPVMGGDPIIGKVFYMLEGLPVEQASPVCEICFYMPPPSAWADNDA